MGQNDRPSKRRTADDAPRQDRDRGTGERSPEDGGWRPTERGRDEGDRHREPPGTKPSSTSPPSPEDGGWDVERGRDEGGRRS